MFFSRLFYWWSAKQPANDSNEQVGGQYRSLLEHANTKTGKGPKMPYVQPRTVCPTRHQHLS